MRWSDQVLRAAWLAQPAYLVGEVLVGVLTGVAYSFRDDTTSALGTSCPALEVSGCSSSPWAMNLVFVAFGALQALGAVLLSRRSGTTHRLVGTLWAVAGTFSILVGLLHARLMPAGATRGVGLLLGVVAVLGAAAFAALLGSPTWAGTVERAAIWPAKVWLLLAAITMPRSDQRR